MPPEVSSVSQVCRTCHAQNGELFDGSKHKKAFEREGWPECEKCHGNHAIEKTSDAMLDEKQNSLCYECHREHARDHPECIETAPGEHDYDDAGRTVPDTGIRRRDSNMPRANSCPAS